MTTQTPSAKPATDPRDNDTSRAAADPMCPTQLVELVGLKRRLALDDATLGRGIAAITAGRAQHPGDLDAVDAERTLSWMRQLETDCQVAPTS